MFNIYPAIDIRRGQVVRLQAGDPARQTVFDSDPVSVARRWAEAGARWLHVVNLDGAFDDASQAAVEFDALLGAMCALGPCVQLGGGVRTLDRIEAVLALGVSRVVLGTAAVEQPRLVREAVAQFGSSNIVIGLDTRAGRVRTRGWQAGGGLAAMELGRQMKSLGVEMLIHTEIERDGLLTGANVQACVELAQACDLAVLVLGGVAGLDDIRRSKAAEPLGVAGVIVGRALYQGVVDLRQALAIAEGQSC